jgi:Holliday junction DNA helicase RuvA
MISRLRGTIIERTDQSMTVDVGGVGFCVVMARISRYTLQQNIDLIIQLHWHQDNGPQLFGFANLAEKQIFNLIISCSGIGPKIALAILDSMTPDSFASAIISGDSKALSHVDGIGIKKAESMIVHLKDKVNKLLQSGTLMAQNPALTMIGKVSEILASLGYSRYESSYALEHLQKIPDVESLSFEELIRKALAAAMAKKQL